MRSRWEYLRLTYQHSTGRKYNKEKQVTEPEWTTEYWLRRPRSDAWESLGSLDDSSGFDTLLDELGAEGWEMVSEHTRSNTVMGNFAGWRNVGQPVAIVWTFKRPAE